MYLLLMILGGHTDMYVQTKCSSFKVENNKYELNTSLIFFPVIFFFI